MLYKHTIDNEYYSSYNVTQLKMVIYFVSKGSYNMKKIISVLLALALMVCAAGSVSASETEALPSRIETVTEGKLTMVTSPDFAPYEFYSLDDEGNPTLVGCDISLGQYIADYLGLALEIIPLDFNGTQTELQMGNADIGMAGYSPKPERMEFMDFSMVYYTGGQAFVCRGDNAAQFPTLEAANSADYQIGAQLASIQYDLAMAHTPNADIVTLNKVTDIIAEVVSGKLDGAFVEKIVAETYCTNYPELTVVLDVPYDAEGSVVGIRKGNTALQDAVNEAIQAAIDDGSMTRFVEEANNLASGSVYEGLLDASGNVPGAQEEDSALLSGKGFQFTFRYIDLFINGLVCTVTLSALTVLFGFILALVLALMRMSSFCPFRFLGTDKLGTPRTGLMLALSKFNPLKCIASVYVEVFRATPLLVQLFIVYYILLADLSLPTFKIFGIIRFERLIPGVIALSLNSAAYLSEIVRSGIQSIDGGQTEAARSLGMTQWQTMQHIVLPQAIKNILPAIANEFVTIIKESSICYTIGVQEIMSAVNSVNAAISRIGEPLIIAACVYFCLTFPTSKIIEHFERKMSRGDKR